MTFEDLINNINEWNVIEKSFKCFDKREINPILYVEYISNYLLLLYVYKYYIDNISSSPIGTPSSQMSISEHRRNAFAHWNFALLPWVDDILLWDPPQDGSPLREEKINLKLLYHECENNMKNIYNSKIKKNKKIQNLNSI